MKKVNKDIKDVKIKMIITANNNNFYCSDHFKVHLSNRLFISSASIFNMHGLFSAANLSPLPSQVKTQTVTLMTQWIYPRIHQLLFLKENSWLFSSARNW